MSAPEVALHPDACVHCGNALAVEATRFCMVCFQPRPSFYAAHGGAGTSMLARLLAGIDAGPAAAINTEGVPGRRLAVLVGRTHLAGLEAIQAVLGAHPGFFDLVVLNRDAPGRISKPIADRAYVITGAAATISCPFVPAWRTDATDTTSKDAATFLTAFRTRYLNPTTTEEN